MPTPTDPSPRSRFRSPVAAPIVTLAILVHGCSNGAGSGPVQDPSILEFRALADDHLLGERARLRVRYVGGPGRIEPDLGPVGNDSVVDTGPLSAANRFELVVGVGAKAVRQSLDLRAGYRGRLREFPQGFAAANHATVATPDGGALVIGGDQGLSVLGSRVYRFDPSTATFAPFAELEFGRDQHRAVLLADGAILVVGGALSANRFDTPSERIDPRTGAVTRSGPLVRNRTGHSATRLGDGRVLVLGGTSTDGIEPFVRASAEVWEPTSGLFRLLPAEMTKPRVGHSATLLPDGRVLVYGGDGRDGSYVAAELFDPVTESFAPLPDPESGLRSMHVAVALADGAVWIGGGEDADGRPRADALVHRPQTGRFEPAAPWSIARSSAAAALLADGRIFVAGGLVAPPSTVTGAAELHAFGAAPVTLPDLAAARRHHTVTRLADGRVLIVGGESSGGLVRSFEILD